MSNPRIVYGRREAAVAFCVRGHIGGETFQMAVEKEAVSGYEQAAIEDRLMEEARSLLRMATGQEGAVDWGALGFSLTGEFGVWNKTLSRQDLKRLLAP